MAADKVAKGSVRQLAWVGDLDSLRHLIAEVAELATYIRNKVAASDAETSEERRAAWEKNYIWMEDDAESQRRWDEHETERVEELSRATELVLRLRQRRWDLELSGDPESVLADLDDPSDVQMVQIVLAETMSRHIGGYSLKIDLDRRSANAWFEGPESQFVDLAGKRLGDEFRRQRPWYWWLRSPNVVWPFVGVAAVASYFLGSWLIAGTGAKASSVYTLQLVFALVVGIGGALLVRLLATPFELFANGKRSRGIRRFTLIGSAALWLIATVVTPVVLWALLPPRA